MQHTVDAPLAPQSGCMADPGAPPWPRCLPLGPPLSSSPGKQTAGYRGFILSTDKLNKNIQLLCEYSAFGDEKQRGEEADIRCTLQVNVIFGWICKNVHTKTRLVHMQRDEENKALKAESRHAHKETLSPHKHIREKDAWRSLEAPCDSGL